MASRLPFDPRAVLMYHGYRFLTRNCSEYRITQEGKIVASPCSDDAEAQGIMLAGGEGVRIRMIAAIESKYYDIRSNGIAPMLSKEQLDELILRRGQNPAPGLHLIVSLANADSELTNRHGMITSQIYKIFIPCNMAVPTARL